MGEFARFRRAITVSLLKTMRVPIEVILTRSSDVPIAPFLDVQDFAWVQEVEAMTERIRQEFHRYQGAGNPSFAIEDISVYQDRLTNDGRWRTVWLLGHGYWAPGAREMFPETCKALDQIPGVRTGFFSILHSGKELPPHRGPYRGLLRYHLGIDVPQTDKCAIRVDNETRHWEVGKSLIFDDTYEHAAHNRGSDARVVLFVDFERPLRQPAATMNRLALGVLAKTPYVRDAKRRLEDLAAGRIKPKGLA